MPSPSKHSDPFDSFDDMDDEFIDYGAKRAQDDFDLNLDEPYGATAPQRDPFGDDYRPQAQTPAQQKQAFASSLGLKEPATTQSLSAQAPNTYAQHPVNFAEDDIGAISIPRIGIHFFPDNEATAVACETASNDRRMSRAQCIVRRGGMFEAIDAYRNEPTPSLIFVESAARGGELLDQLGQLAEVCDANTKVVVIGAHNDIMLFRELIRQGVSDYVVGPAKPLQLIKVISTLFNDPETPFTGRTIAFVGARGGAGSSSLAHNFAYNLSEQMHANTVIVDYDLPFGTAGLDFNHDPPHGMADALNEPDRLDSVLLDRMLTKCTDRLSLFSAPAALDQDYTADPESYDEVTRKIRSAAPFIVMDLPHVWTPWLKSNLISADEVVIVATPDLASLRNAKNIIDLLKHSRPNDSAPKLVLNQMDMPGRPEIPVKDFTAALGLEPCALIPFDAKLFGQASNNGQMIAECGPTSKVADALTDLTTAITGRAPEPKPKTSFLGSLFKSPSNSKKK